MNITFKNPITISTGSISKSSFGGRFWSKMGLFKYESWFGSWYRTEYFSWSGSKSKPKYRSWSKSRYWNWPWSHSN